MRETYLITKSKEKNSLWLFEEREFNRFSNQLTQTAINDNRTAAMIVLYFMETVVDVKVDINQMNDVLDAVRDIPKLWNYLTDGKQEGIQVFQLDREQVEGRGYNPWVLRYVPKE